MLMELLMHKAAQARDSNQIPDNIVLFPPRHRHKIQREMEIAYDIKKQPHFMILLLGMMIGGMLALFIGYHIQHYALSYLILAFIPIAMAIFLRKIYIHTLIETMKR